MTAIAIFGLAAISFGQTLPSYVPADGLVGWWPFNGNANDESGNGNDGTVNGATLSSDRFGDANNSYNFNGVNDYIAIPQSNYISNINTEASFSSWVFSENGINYIMCKSNSSVGEYRFFIVDSIFKIVINSKEYEIVSNFPIQQWFHIMATYANDELRLYLNGGLLGSTSFVINNYPPSDTTTQLEFGRDPWGLDEFHLGLLDDIGIWNRALTQEEITSLYSGSSVGIYEVSQSNLFSVFPNPAQSIINVNIDAKLLGSVFTIYDNIGKAVKKGKLNSINTTIEVNDLSGGIYSFSVGGNSKQTFKIIKE